MKGKRKRKRERKKIREEREREATHSNRMNVISRRETGGLIVKSPFEPPLLPSSLLALRHFDLASCGAGLTAIRISFLEFIFITNKLFSPVPGFEPIGMRRPVTSTRIIHLIGERAGEKASRLFQFADIHSSIDIASSDFDGHFCHRSTSGIKVK